MSDPQPEQIDALMGAFEGFTRRFKMADAKAAAESGLNSLDFQTLLYISANPATPLTDVARHLDVAVTTMSSSADRLVRKGMIDRRRPPGDRRTVALEATPEGRAVAESHRVRFHRAIAWMLAALDEDERAALVRLSEKIARSDP